MTRALHLKNHLNYPSMIAKWMVYTEGKYWGFFPMECWGKKGEMSRKFSWFGILLILLYSWWKWYATETRLLTSGIGCELFSLQKCRRMDAHGWRSNIYILPVSLLYKSYIIMRALYHMILGQACARKWLALLNYPSLLGKKCRNSLLFFIDLFLII